MSDLRAEIFVRALQPVSGESSDFSCYEYNTDNLSAKKFKKYINDNAVYIAEDYCDGCGLDFVSILSIDFDYVEVD